jgi:hypothetical protein
VHETPSLRVYRRVYCQYHILKQTQRALLKVPFFRRTSTAQLRAVLKRRAAWPSVAGGRVYGRDVGCIVACAAGQLRPLSGGTGADREQCGRVGELSRLCITSRRHDWPCAPGRPRCDSLATLSLSDSANNHLSGSTSCSGTHRKVLARTHGARALLAGRTVAGRRASALMHFRSQSREHAHAPQWKPEVYPVMGRDSASSTRCRTTLELPAGPLHISTPLHSSP